VHEAYIDRIIDLLFRRVMIAKEDYNATNPLMSNGIPVANLSQLLQETGAFPHMARRRRQT
jgi:hypothetical protein